ncbi:bile acid:sodium symporter [Noviherbaspirillum sp. CPCC 100848]|uniref:Bile acid:sodium symporter n=1 Tax=Noviherbaspirillum album TaxID=3080276 RepID=A0ABU6J477_9BURK|nr:bile acid:sodium symporter [Noviherbaspirillum sp. CPCC 100848]MEC4718415.1 bile acid:sodium symporter [Noviherbaspirillum sp. CPCC 100848]
MNRESLEKNQIPIYFAAVVAAAVGGLAAPTASQNLDVLVTPAIAVLMYAMFLQIPFLDLKDGISNKKFIAAILVANFLFVPLLVWILTRGLSEHPAILVGALLVLLTPCIDYVVVFTHIGKGDSKLVLAATPVLLLLQLILLPIYLGLMIDSQNQIGIAIGPFVEAFLVLIAAPLILSVATSVLAKKSDVINKWNAGWAWLPVPAMAAVLIVVIGSQISAVVSEIDRLIPVVPVYIGFMVLAPIVGALTSRIFNLQAEAARAVTFSSSTRNSLVVLPLALALPEELRGIAAAAVITQTLIELVSELVYIRLIPALVWRKRNSPMATEH